MKLFVHGERVVPGAYAHNLSGETPRASSAHGNRHKSTLASCCNSHGPRTTPARVEIPPEYRHANNHSIWRRGPNRKTSNMLYYIYCSHASIHMYLVFLCFASQLPCLQDDSIGPCIPAVVFVRLPSLYHPQTTALYTIRENGISTSLVGRSFLEDPSRV